MGNKGKALLTGSQGFLGSYICMELLNHGYDVVGVDNFSKYGEVARPQDSHTHFNLYNTDILDAKRFNEIVWCECPDYIIAAGCLIGGIAYFHKYAYDLLATNERIIANTYDAAIKAYKDGYLKRVVVISSSMVFESVKTWPTKETDLVDCASPVSSYGFQKLACEYFAKAAYDQYQVPYTIVRPFNAVGVGELPAKAEHSIMSGNVKLQMSHVLPDLVNKILLGQDPLVLLGDGNQKRSYTNGTDIACGVRLAMESEAALGEAFNIASPVTTTVLELAEMVWNKLNPGKPFNYVCEPGFEHDVACRIPDVEKARKVLGFKAEVPLDKSIDEVIEYVKAQLPH